MTVPVVPSAKLKHIYKIRFIISIFCCKLPDAYGLRVFIRWQQNKKVQLEPIKVNPDAKHPHAMVFKSNPIRLKYFIFNTPR